MVTQGRFGWLIRSLVGCVERARSMPVRICVERALYGSFAQTRGGYRLAARTQGCQERWIGPFIRLCQRSGDPGTSRCGFRALIAAPVDRDTWAIIRVFPAGDDDFGRPGALEFRACFVSAQHYRRIGAAPFSIAELGDRLNWTPGRTLAPAVALIEPFGNQATESAGATVSNARAASIAAEIAKGSRVCLRSEEPIDSLAIEVWRQLSARARMRSTLATWTHAASGEFQLSAVRQHAISTIGALGEAAVLR